MAGMFNLRVPNGALYGCGGRQLCSPRGKTVNFDGAVGRVDGQLITEKLFLDQPGWEGYFISWM